MDKDGRFHITGYLKKRNTKASSKLVRNWDKRWFALDSNRLLYATSAKDKQPKQVFSVREIQDVRFVEGDDEKERRFEFEVLLPGRVLRLRPYSESQRRHWVAQLQAVQQVSSESEADGKSSCFDRVLETNSADAVPSVIADKIRRTLFRRKKRTSQQLDELKAKCEKRIPKSVDDGVISLRESYQEDILEARTSQAMKSEFFSQSRPERVSVEIQPRKGKWTADIETASEEMPAAHQMEEVTSFERGWSDDDEMLGPTTPKRKTLAGPRTPSPELAPTHPRKTPKAHRQAAQQIRSSPASVASPVGKSHINKATKLYDNALFKMYDNGDQVQAIGNTNDDDSDWDASSEDEF